VLQLFALFKIFIPKRDSYKIPQLRYCLRNVCSDKINILLHELRGWVKMTSRFRLMFVVRFPQQLAFLTCVGVDYNSSSLFSVLLYSSDDKVIINHKTAHYPKDLVKYLETQKELIDSGFYDIRTWEMTLFDEKLKERKNLLKDRGTKKWTSFLLPEQKGMLKERYMNVEKVEKPILDEYEWEEVGRQIGKSLETQIPIILKLYRKGSIRYQGGVVVKIDPIQKRIEIKNADNRLEKVSIAEIVGVEAL
jgi:hypothetical protein